MRGERWVIRRSVISHPGSSPHTRGTQNYLDSQEMVDRFIPAYAGNARYKRQTAPHGTVHPRIRGERTPATLPIEASFGTSPHTRGTHVRAVLLAVLGRFIPAYAGNASYR